jgi:hypothetical protein
MNENDHDLLSISENDEKIDINSIKTITKGKDIENQMEFNDL